MSDYLGGCLHIDLADADTAAGVVSQLNPEGVALIITDCIVNVTTVATAACTLDVGVAATAVSADTLLDGIDVNSAIGLFDLPTNKGTNGKTVLAWGATSYLTASMKTGAAAGLEGVLYVRYIYA